MNKDDFVKKYHKHFQNSFHDPNSLYGYQVYVPDSWLEYIDAALDHVLSWKTVDSEGNSISRYGDFQIHQIKEKFGGLRFYFSAEDDVTDSVLDGVVMALEGVISLLEKDSKNNHENHSDSSNSPRPYCARGMDAEED